MIVPFDKAARKAGNLANAIHGCWHMFEFSASLQYVGLSTARYFLASAAVCVFVATADPACADSNDIGTLLFASVDAGKTSAFASAGGKLPYRIGYQTTAFVMVDIGMSLSDMRRANDGKLARDAIASHARLLIGAERSFGPLFVSVALGPSINTWQGKTGIAYERFGAVAHAAIWHRPTAVDAFSVTTIIDTAPKRYWIRVRYGRKFAAMPFAFGPESSFSHSRITRKTQVGLHVSELALGRVNLSVSGGWMWDSGKPGPYLTASAYMKY